MSVLTRFLNVIQSPHYYYGRSFFRFALHNFIKHLNYFRRRGPSMSLLKKTKELKNSKTDKIALVLGNGPSLKKIDYGFISRNVDDIFVVNDFYLTSLVGHITPNYYVFSDPASFFETNDGHRHSKVDLLAYLEKIKPKLILSHFARKSFFTDSFEVLYFDDREWNFFSKNISPLRPRCYSSITSMKALAFACFMGYKQIYILGFDNTEFFGYRSDRDNRLWLDTKSTYSSKEEEKSKLLDMSGFVSGIAGRLQSYAHAYGDFKLFHHSNIVNLDSDSLITYFKKYE